jgi:Zn-dependent peptidase ImmA (M78 family)
LGHFVSRTEQPDEYEYIDYRDQRSASGLDPDEVYANNFAAALLMPAHEVRRLKEEGYSEVELAWKFDVSLEAMMNRLNLLRLS